MKRLPEDVTPLVIILIAILFTFILARLVAFLIIYDHLPGFLFASFGDFRLHHFVYGNVIILVTSFLAIGLGARKHKNTLALLYGFGLGLILDEFLLWLGNVTQLTSTSMFIPFSLTAVSGATLIISLIIIYKLYRNNHR